MFKYVSIALLLFCAACSEEVLPVPFQQEIDHYKYMAEVYSFRVPDSIDKSLVKALYYNIHLKTHAILFYRDTSLQEAVNMEFFPDGSVVTDRLIQKKFNEFVSVSDHSEYILRESSVTHIYMSGSLSMTEEHVRTDKGIPQ